MIRRCTAQHWAQSEDRAGMDVNGGSAHLQLVVGMQTGPASISHSCVHPVMCKHVHSQPYEWVFVTAIITKAQRQARFCPSACRWTNRSIQTVDYDAGIERSELGLGCNSMVQCLPACIRLRIPSPAAQWRNDLYRDPQNVNRAPTL